MWHPKTSHRGWAEGAHGLNCFGPQPERGTGNWQPLWAQPLRPLRAQVCQWLRLNGSTVGRCHTHGTRCEPRGRLTSCSCRQGSRIACLPKSSARKLASRVGRNDLVPQKGPPPMVSLASRVAVAGCKVKAAPWGGGGGGNSYFETNQIKKPSYLPPARTHSPPPKKNKVKKKNKRSKKGKDNQTNLRYANQQQKQQFNKNMPSDKRRMHPQVLLRSSPITSGAWLRAPNSASRWLRGRPPRGTGSSSSAGRLAGEPHHGVNSGGGGGGGVLSPVKASPRDTPPDQTPQVRPYPR